ncbi:MAG: CBS domain-containing protein [Methylobacter sp.]
MQYGASGQISVLPAGFMLNEVRYIMVSNPAKVPVGATLAQAAELMGMLSIGCLLIEDSGVIVGILTEHDIIRALWQRLPLDHTVDDLATRDVVSVKDSEECYIAYRTMEHHGFRHLLVVDRADKPVGVVSESDFRKNCSIESLAGTLNVAGTLSSKYLSLSVDCLVIEAAGQMQEHGIGCAVVLQDRKPVGIVTERDMVRLFLQQNFQTPIAEAMSAPVYSVTANMQLSDALPKMRALKIRRFAVVDEHGHMVGMLDEHFLARQLAEELQALQTLVAKQAQKLDENIYHSVVNRLPQKILVKDTASVYISCNESYASDLGIRPAEIKGKTDFDFFPKELAESYRADDRKVMSEQITLSIEEPYVKDGERFWIHTTKAPLLDKQANVNGIVAIFHDITQAKRTAEKLKRRSWALEALRRSGKAMIFSETEADLLQSVCDALTVDNLYVLAWVGWARQDEERSVEIVASSGIAQNYLQDLKVSWTDNQLGNGPTGRAIRFGRPMTNNHALENTDFSPWYQKARSFDIRSSAALPVIVDGKVAGALTIYSKETEAFGDSEIRLFEELVSNLGFGIQSRRTRAAYEQSLQERAAQAIRLERLLEETLMTVSATLEQRDPYTAGHQKHVADLAVSIGREMGLEDNRLRGLHLAATVHDLGKIHIPAEILAKPGRLSAAEFALVKTHAEVGYNILSTLEFPWPIAEIIRQHHEYLDGSGYPHGLKGDEIMLEARIITVADIVESMSSDRPYRPALDIDVAKQEIRAMRGNKLDSVVVDACLKVIGDGHFLPKFL